MFLSVLDFGKKSEARVLKKLFLKKETVLSVSNIARSSGNLCGLNAHPSSGCMRAGSKNSSGAHVQFNTETERKNEANQVSQCDTFILADGSVELNTNDIFS